MSKPRFCSQCGSSLDAHDNFCTGCGAPVSDPAAAPGAQAEPQGKEPARRKPSPIPMIALILLAILGSGAAMLYKTGFTLPENMGKAQTPPEDLTRAAAFLPAPDKAYTYYSEYVDGSSHTFDQLVGKKPEAPAVALISLIPESEAFTLYVVPREGGLYMISDQDMNAATFYLPDGLAPGKTWEEPGFRGQVLATGETCDVGFAQFEDCLLLSLDYYEATVQYTAWYAPAVGVVKMVYTGSGQTATLLKGIREVPPEEMQRQLDRYAPNLSLVK